MIQAVNTYKIENVGKAISSALQCFCFTCAEYDWQVMSGQTVIVS